VQFIYSLWLRVSVPLLILIAVYGYSFVFVSESSLTSCTGGLTFSYGSNYRSDANGSQWFRFIFSQNNFGFGIKDCSVKSFSMQSISILTPSFDLIDKLQQAQQITVWFRKRNVGENDCIPIRISVGGAMIFSEWDHVRMWSLFTYPLAAAVALWLFSMFSLLMGRDKKAIAKMQLNQLPDGRENFSGSSLAVSAKANTKKPSAISDKIWATAEGKYRGLIAAMHHEPDAFVVAWFPDSKQEIEQWLKKNIGALPFKINLITELTAQKVAERILVVLERYPSGSMEKQQFDRLNVSTVIVLSSLDDVFLKVCGGDSIKSVMKLMGAEQDEVIEHSMITSSIEAMQKRIEEKMISDVAANSAGEWFEQNKIYSIK